MPGDLEPERIVRLEDDAVVVLDQRRLPDEMVELRCHDAAELADAIRTLAVRGAPAIGVAAAYGMALAAVQGHDLDEAYDDARRLAPDGGQPPLGARRDAPRPDAGARAADPRRRGRALPRDGRARGRARAARTPGS